MNRTLFVLAGLLAVQVIAAAGLGFARTGISGPAKETPLVALAGHPADRITIEGPDKAKVVLADAKGTWQLPELGNFPADPARVKELVDALSGLKEGLPVATTRDAQARFKVSDTDFERRITLESGGHALGTLYFGTSPSMREIHARRAGQSDVYAVQFASWQMPVKTTDWENKTLLQIPVKEITAIDVPGIHLVRGDDVSGMTDASGVKNASGGKGAKVKETAWQASGLTAGETLDPKAADALASSLADLEFDHVLAGPPSADDGLTAPALEITVTKRGGASVVYRIGKAKDGKTYTLKSSARSEYFALPTYAAEPLIAAAARDKLLGLEPAKVSAKH
ncbi:MAG: DUF4340 domain-containing protein [Casimicrobiaceae bacterium]